MSRSRAKYSVKKRGSCARDWPYSVCNMACPVRSDAAAVRNACSVHTTYQKGSVRDCDRYVHVTSQSRARLTGAVVYALATKRALINFAFLRAREGHAIMLQLEHSLR